MGELRAPKHENYGTSPPPWHPHSDDTLADIGAGSLKPIHLSDPAALLPPPLTSLADLETDALAYVLACLMPADLPARTRRCLGPPLTRGRRGGDRSARE